MSKVRDKSAALVMDTSHQYQTHHDKVDASEQIRPTLEQHIREIISERNIELIAEEAGNEKEVWTALKGQGKRIPKSLVLS